MGYQIMSIDSLRPWETMGDPTTDSADLDAEIERDEEREMRLQAERVEEMVAQAREGLTANGRRLAAWRTRWIQHTGQCHDIRAHIHRKCHGIEWRGRTLGAPLEDCDPPRLGPLLRLVTWGGDNQ